MQIKEQNQLDADELKEAVFSETVALSYNALPGSVIATVIVAALLSFVLSQIFVSAEIFIWLAVVIVINLVRFISYKSYQKNNKSNKAVRRFDSWFYYLLVLNGLCFSLISILFLPESNSAYHYFPIMVIVGVTAGAVTSLSYRRRNLITYYILLLSPIVAHEIIEGTFISYSVSALVLLLTFFSLINATRIRRTAVESITLQFGTNLLTEALIVSTDAAIEANSAKSTFVSMVSHELRTPLNGMLGYAQLIKMSKSPLLGKEQKENTDNLIMSGKYLLSLIEELLDLSSIESNNIKLNLGEISLNAVIEISIALLKPIAAFQNIEINNNMERDFLVMADVKRLKQIIINLVSNAVKYNSENGSVTITTDRVADNKVRIFVTDKGDGLTEQQVKGLFQPFNRYNTKKEGLGLGLYITKNIVELMGGEIGVSSVKNNGSTFWFDIPLVKN